MRKGRKGKRYNEDMSLLTLCKRKEALWLLMTLPLMYFFFMTLNHGRGKVKGDAVSVSPSVGGYSVKQSFPHDPLAFTQGLQYEQLCNGEGIRRTCTDILWESTGLYGRSTVRQVDLKSGKVLQELHLEKEQFGEGLAKIGSNIYTLTWHRGTIMKWIVEGGVLHKVGEFQGPLKDGWGLTTDGQLLLATDSSATLYFIDPGTMQVVRKQLVTDEGRPIKWLNELELIDGELWANVWMTECIARIDLQTGMVKHWMLLNGLKQGLKRSYPTVTSMDVLNGIAYDHATKRILVTGKKWPLMFEIEPKDALEPDNAAARHTLHTLGHARQQCIPH